MGKDNKHKHIAKSKDKNQSLKGAEKILKKNAVDEAILSSIGDGLVVVDKEGKITYVNQVFEKVLGWKSEEVIGKRIGLVVPQKDVVGNIIPFNEMILNKIFKGTVVVADLANPFYLTRKDKSSFPASALVSPIVVEREVVGAVKTFRDITKEKEVDNAKTEFVSLVSHQLRAPLSTISWYAETLLSGDAGKLNSKQEKYLEEIYKGNQHMVSLVNSLLSVSRMDSGIFALQPEPTDIVLLVQSVVAEQKPHIEQKKIKITLEFGVNIPIINVDPKLLSMAVQNLLSNSMKYTPERGSIKLSMSLDSKKDRIIFAVTDTGFGIPEDQHNKIFTKLFRTDKARENDNEGTGLGLYIVKAIVDNSGGRVWFESKENKGSTFYVELPSNLLVKENKKIK
ncbi:MAG: PAS domain-containing sensor histidine kinase [bacterium]|nr:PAS domain-containing sensor histidine kinase [bacterium]